ncbi:MAG TPA: peptidylprolyl isomerase [Gemmatimonadaceae bacterium]
MSIKVRSGFAFAVLAVLAACDSAPPPPAEQPSPTPLPTPEVAPVTAPGQFRVHLETSRGRVVIEVHRDWAPNGVDRFYQLVEAGFYDNARFFRVVPGFMAQFGMNGDSATNAIWANRSIQDDPVVQSNKRGMITFANRGIPHSRSAQLFINLVDNPFLDPQNFAPFGQVVEGMSVVDALFGGYGEARPQGQGPSQEQITTEGNAYLEREFPRLDFIRTARVVK